MRRGKKCTHCEVTDHVQHMTPTHGIASHHGYHRFGTSAYLQLHIPTDMIFYQQQQSISFLIALARQDILQVMPSGFGSAGVEQSMEEGQALGSGSLISASLSVHGRTPHADCLTQHTSSSFARMHINSPLSVHQQCCKHASSPIGGLNRQAANLSSCEAGGHACRSRTFSLGMESAPT